MCGVAGQEDPPTLERVRRLGHCTPLVDVEHVDLQLWITDRIAHQLHRHVVGDRVGHEAGPRLVDVADGEHHQESAEARLLQPEEPAHLWVVDVDHAEVPAAQGRRAVGTEVDRDAARQQAVTDHRDPEAFADRTAIAVAGDEISGADLLLTAVVDVANGRGHAVVVLCVADQLRRVLEAGAELAGPLQQDRLEHLLRHEQSPSRADVGDAVVDVGDVVGDFPPDQCLDGVETSVGFVQLQRCGTHAILDAGDPHQFDGPKLEVPGPRMDGGAVVLLHRQHLDAVLGEEHRRRQSDEASTDDQDGYFDTCG